MISVLVLVMVFTYDGAFKQQKKNEWDQFADEETTNDNLLTKRVGGIIHVMHDLTTNRIVNSNDVNTMFTIWSTTMNKRGIPTLYTTPELFTELRAQTVRGDMSPESVEAAILPYYRREIEMIKNKPKHQPFKPVCLNY